MCEFITFYPDEDEVESFILDIKKSYNLAKKFFNLAVYHVDNYIVTRTNKYNGDLNFLLKNSSLNNDNILNIIDEIAKILLYMKDNQIVHHDFAFRNICYMRDDDLFKLYLIDFEQLNICESETYSSKENIEQTYTYICHEIEKNFGLQYSQIFKNKIFINVVI